MVPRDTRAAVLLSAAALALAADPVAGRVRDRSCHDNPDLPAAKLLSGADLDIGLYVSGDTNQCSGSACELYERVTREENNENTTWTGFDIELIEELAKRGNFTYTIVSMGGAYDGNNHTIANTEIDGTPCDDCKAAALPLSVHRLFPQPKEEGWRGGWPEDCLRPL